MRPSENIEKLIAKLNVTPRAEMRQRTLRDVLEAQEKSKKTASAHPTPSIRRLIMNKSISKLLINPMKFMALLHDVGIIELFEARKLIEVTLVRVAANNAKKKDIDKMEILLEKARNLLSEPKKYLYAEMEFHEAIFEASGNRILTAMMVSINNLLLESRRRTVMLFKKLDGTLDDHHRIMEAIKSKDPDRAGKAMYDHLNLVEDTLKRNKSNKS